MTADVQAVLDGSPHHGWLISPETGFSSLWARFDSRETTNPPRLVLHGNDLCPDNPDKVHPGHCGCDAPDDDSDNDGLADCLDGCPDDPDKTAPGECRCGIPDDDADADGTADCRDACPADPNATQYPCSPDTGCTQATLNDSTYFFCPGKRGYNEAKGKCVAIGFQLARIDNAAENAFIMQRIVGSKAFVGGSDVATEGTWVWDIGGDAFWQGGASGAPVAGRYANWTSGQPNNLGNQDCLVVESTGKWGDVGCADKEAFVCEQLSDECPDNPAKSRAGLCGCDLPDTDADDDGVPACKDDCDHDPTRVTYGECGCKDEPLPRPEGVACGDRPCPGAPLGEEPAPAVCDGAGSCGSPTLDECLGDGPSQSCEVEVYQGHAYLFCTNNLTPDQASDHCNSAGMELVRIDDVAEDAFVADHLSETSWIGASDSGFEGDWRWIDGDVKLWLGDDSGTAVLGRYENWESGEPSTSGDCAVYNVSTGSPTGWDDRDCGTSQGFVCEVVDQCPNDPSKTKPGFCDCGATDHIVMVDGKPVVVCTDECPDDPTKTTPGRCGCGRPESSCPLECPENLSDPSSPVYGKLQAGRCGCATPDVDANNNGALDCFEEEDPDCIVDGVPAAPGTPCTDSICKQSCVGGSAGSGGSIPTVCDGAGVCGDPSECEPTGGGACTWKLFRGHVYWFCEGPRTRDTRSCSREA